MTPFGGEQGDLLDLIGNDPRKNDEYTEFVTVAQRVSELQPDPGIVSPNVMREVMSNQHGLTIEPRRYSSFWRRARLDGHLERTGEWETNTDAKGRNSGKPQPVYRWVGKP